VAIILKKIKIFSGIIVFFSISLCSSDILADTEETSPWLLTPTVSSDPKLGTTLGFLGAYIHSFDDESPASMFGITGSYSSTDSVVGGAFARTYFDKGSQRVISFIGGGNIKNDYSDYLGSGLPVSTTDGLNMFVLRYLHRAKGNWFAGLQAANTNYTISGDDIISDDILDRIGLVGFDSIGVGLATHYDSRDNQNSPTSGHSLEINNLAYRKSFGGDTSFDTYTLHLKSFFEHGDQNVFALNLSGRWTSSAPTSGYSSVQLRGYTRGQYLAPHMTSFEIEERIVLYKRWTGTLFTGVACLYGGNASCDDSSNLYPAAGAGVRYLIKPEEKMVVAIDLAYGKSGNNGFYMKFGQAF
jgi:hypothetical protein